LYDQAFVETGLPGEVKPVALALDRHPELPRIDGKHAHALALGPFDGGHRSQGRQRFDQAESLLGVFDQPFAEAFATIETGQGVEHRFEMPALGVEVALSADPIRLAA
jgi:hypothetical protein